MASQEFIIMCENCLNSIRTMFKDVKQAATLEVQHGGIPENRDCWGTLESNMLVLRSEMDETLVSIREAMDKNSS